MATPRKAGRVPLHHPPTRTPAAASPFLGLHWRSDTLAMAGGNDIVIEKIVSGTTYAAWAATTSAVVVVWWICLLRD